LKFTLISGSSARFLAFCGLTLFSDASVLALSPHRVQVIPSYHNDVSAPLREMPAWDITDHRQEREAAENPKIPNLMSIALSRLWITGRFCVSFLRAFPDRS